MFIILSIIVEMTVIVKLGKKSKRPPYRTPKNTVIQIISQPSSLQNKGYTLPVFLRLNQIFRVPARAGELANFLAAPAQTFFFKQLRLLIFFPSGSGSGSGSWYFFQAAPASRVKLQKKIKQVK